MNLTEAKADLTEVKAQKTKAKREVRKSLSRLLDSVSIHDADTRVCLKGCVDSFLITPSASNYVRVEFLVNKIGLAFTPVRINFMNAILLYQEIYNAENEARENLIQ